MELALSFLGTGASVPSARRNTQAVLVSRGGEQLLFDCGEGTQRQMQRSLGLVSVDRIFLSHYHADHVLGLPGLIKTYGLLERTQPLDVYGPPGLKALFDSFKSLIGRTGYRINLIEVEAGDRLAFGRREGDAYEIEVFATRHRLRSHGYGLVEDERPGRFDPEAATRLGVPAGPDFRRLQLGEPVEGARGVVRPEQVMGAPRRGRRVVITGDTAPCMATLEAAADADLLVHEATFADEDLERAGQTGHSTARQAAALAAEAAVGMLAITHLSSRYHVKVLLDEAREEFENVVAPRDFDLIRVPFPERGGPELVEGGVKRRPAPTEARESE